jgi:hypothetical protein
MTYPEGRERIKATCDEGDRSDKHTDWDTDQWDDAAKHDLKKYLITSD